jgi:hypothetical protein
LKVAVLANGSIQTALFFISLLHRTIMTTPIKLAYVCWKDAVAEEGAGEAHTTTAQLVELQEVGFLGMEKHDDATVQPGRWRLHVPRVSIQEMRVVDLDKAFSARRPRKKAAM